MKKDHLIITKASGKQERFSIEKLRASLKLTGADKVIIDQIIDEVVNGLYQGISTKDIYNRAFTLLNKRNGTFASKYKLKKAIYELGSTGFPFERFIAEVFTYSGHEVEIGRVLQGKCVHHNIDVFAQKANETVIIECKFLGEQGVNCDIKVPLYVHSCYQDIKAYWNASSKNGTPLTKGWVVTNAKFTRDAIQYGNCCGLQLLSWDYPQDDGLKDRIERLGLYPITVSTLLTPREKQFLLSRNLVLYMALLNDKFYLEHLGISDRRKQKILHEISQLCGTTVS